MSRAFNSSIHVSLGEIASISREKSDPLSNPGAPYIGLEHIEKDLGTISGHGKAAEVRSTKAVFRQGDLLYGKLRPYLNKVWIAQFDGLCSTDILVFPKTGTVDNAFLKYRFLTTDFVNYASENSSGVNLPRVNAKVLEKFSVWLPPLEEQRKIVAEIEKQFTRLDAGVAALKRVQVNLKRYRASVLKAACEGRLVPTEASRSGVSPLNKQKRQDAASTFEPASVLLERILDERRKNWTGRGKYKEPTPPDTSNLPELPEKWVWASLEQVLLNVTDGDHQPPPQSPAGVPFLVIGNVRLGRIDFRETRFVSRDYADSVDPFRKPRAGDILYTLVGSFGIAVPVLTNDEFCIQRHIGILRPHKYSPSPFLLHVLNSSFAFQQASNMATGTAQKTVPLSGLRRMAIPLPPLAEQKRIVAEVERRLSVIEETEAVVNANLQRAARLRQAILQQAFSGKLITS